MLRYLLKFRVCLHEVMVPGSYQGFLTWRFMLVFVRVSDDPAARLHLVAKCVTNALYRRVSIEWAMMLRTRGQADSDRALDPLNAILKLNTRLRHVQLFGSLKQNNKQGQKN